jgi:hypothetical protein
MMPRRDQQVATESVVGQATDLVMADQATGPAMADQATGPATADQVTEGQVTGGQGEFRRRRRWRRRLLVGTYTDPERMAALALTRLEEYRRVSLRSAGAANEKTLQILTRVLSECGKARWLADALGGQMPVVIATVSMSWITFGHRVPVPAMDVVISVEEEEIIGNEEDEEEEEPEE